MKITCYKILEGKKLGASYNTNAKELIQISVKNTIMVYDKIINHVLYDHIVCKWRVKA